MVSSLPGLVVCVGSSLFSSYLTISGVPRTTGVSSPHSSHVIMGEPYRIEWSQGTIVISVSTPSEFAPNVT